MSKPTLFRLIVLLCCTQLLCGCGDHWFEDNGTHLANVMEAAVASMNASDADSQVVTYTTLDDVDTPYYVELTPSYWKGNHAYGSYLVVSGTTSGGTSYHNRFVNVPKRLYVNKPDGGVTHLLLQRNDSGISVISVY